MFRYTSNTIYRRVLLTLAGIGLGFGIGIMVGLQPDVLTAQPERLSQQSLVTAELLSLHNQNYRLEEDSSLERFFLTPQAKAVVLGSHADLESTRPVVLGIGARNSVAAQLLELSLGDEIQIYGSNQGLYSYQVIEIRQQRRDQLQAVVQEPGLVVLTPSSILQDSITAIIAR